MSGRIQQIPMPWVDEGSHEFTMTAWHKRAGAEVAADKVNIEIRSPVAGTLTETLADEDATVVAGQSIASIEPAEPATADGSTDGE